MNKLASFLLVLISLTFLACESSTSKQSNTTEEIEVPLPPNNIIDAPEAFSMLFAPGNGVLRGADFTSTKEAVKGMESAELLADEANSLMYTMDLNPVDFADVTYTFGAQDLDKILVDIYTEDLASASAYQEILEDFFDAKYKGRSQLWDGSENGITFTANIINSDDEESPGLVLIWEELLEE